LGSTLAPNTTTYTDNGVVANTTYYYRVVAFNNIDTSYSSGDSARLCTVGINAVPSNSFELTVWPNPINNELNIDNLNAQIKSFEVVNLLGEVILSQNTSNSQIIKLNTSNLNPGIYFIKAKNGNGNVSVVRIVKERE
jgi:hypothetical protein